MSGFVKWEVVQGQCGVWIIYAGGLSNEICDCVNEEHAKRIASDHNNFDKLVKRLRLADALIEDAISVRLADSVAPQADALSKYGVGALSASLDAIRETLKATEEA